MYNITEYILYSNLSKGDEFIDPEHTQYTCIKISEREYKFVIGNWDVIKTVNKEHWLVLIQH